MRGLNARQDTYVPELVNLLLREARQSDASDIHLVPTDAIVANLNIDGGNVLGETRDLNVLGDTKSSLGATIADLVRPRGMRLSPDDHPERGYFYRSDHFAFAKVGVPAVSIGEGSDFVGRPAGWGAEQNEDYTVNRYHQPSDEYRAD